jgi:hypothetical protein
VEKLEMKVTGLLEGHGNSHNHNHILNSKFAHGVEKEHAMPHAPEHGRWRGEDFSI